MQQQAVVVGGGIVGIFSAIYLKRHFKDVVLIEKEERLGGLLTSYQDHMAISYDYGTHIPCQTFIPEVDGIVFDKMPEHDWEIFKQLKVGNYFNGVYNEKTGFPNLLSLPRSIYAEGIVDFLNGGHANSEYENLKQYLTAVYGDIFSKEVYEPIMRKLLNKSTEQLHINAFKIFDIKRLVVGDVNLTKELKKSELIDSKCAYPNYEIGVSSNLKYYPKNNIGIKKWIDTLEKKAREEGVKIKLGATIQEIKYDSEYITSIMLDNGEVFSTEKVVWTIPNQYLLRVIGAPMNGLTPPEFREMRLYNFNFNKQFKVNEHYIYCFDTNLHSYRITLYPNLTDSLIKQNIFNCTVEVLTQRNEQISSDCIINELIEMGIIDKTFEVVSSSIRSIEKGFPVFTPEIVNNMKKSYEILTAKVENLVLLGKGKGNAFFMVDSLREAYEVLSSKYER